MPQRSLASLVLGPVLIGILCLALACVAGARTDRLGDTLTVADTLHTVDSTHVADTLRKSDSTRAAAADSAAASQLAVVVDSATLKQGTSQQGSVSGANQGRGHSSECCQTMQLLHHHGDRPLSPVADSIASRLVFVPTDRSWFPVASRGRHMLVDIGRVDLTLKSDSMSRAGYLEAVARLSPLPLGAVLRLRAPYSIDEQTKVVGFDIWRGRIVAKVTVSHLLDSLARAEDWLPAVAIRTDTAPGPRATSDTSRHATTAVATGVGHTDSIPPAPPPACLRDTLPTEITTRAIAVRDSLVRFLTDSAKPPYERQLATAKIQSWWVPGCFGLGRALIIANKHTPEMDFAVERVALLDSTGKTVPLRMVDLRFHAHDPLYVFDADGDGIDDLAARGLGDRSGGLTILRLDVAAKRFVRLVSGFAWEQ
ncbi:MAG TPA: hypothetical protein VJN70_11060 [Gemmatimonadaceae bacterium]|nr:hypothetical protein [Gemmatimonadaceae bacterium]